VQLGYEIKRLAKHSAIYGLGGLVSRILAVLLLPLYTSYLHGRDYGRVETLTALSAVLVVLLRMGISSAFFRFYFDSEDEDHRTLVVRTSFWFTMASATLGLVAGCLLAAPIAQALSLGHGQEWLVRAAFVGLWAQMNYEQLTSLFRVEERSVQFVLASLANVLVTVAATVALVVGAHERALGVIVGNFTGTLVVYFVLLAYRRFQLGLQFDRKLLRAMNRFGMPLVPSALALWVLTFADRVFIAKYKGQTEVGHYSIGVRLASAILLLLVAFRTAWPAFAYSIEDDREAKRAYGFVLTYLLFITCWTSLGLGLLAPWLVHLLTAKPEYYSGARVVAPLAFSGAAWAAYTVVAIGIGRARRTQFNWVVTGAAAALNIGLNFWLVPAYGMVGAAYASLAAFAVMWLFMTWHAQRVYPVPYQWRRIVLAVALAAGLTALGKAIDVSLPGAILLIAVYPLSLLPLGFYLPAELRRLRAFGRRLLAPAR
jgi:O-antigen/teichoic acid export membrane protein